MRQQGKVLITTDGRFDLNEYHWDDDRFADLLVRQNALNSEQAMTISRFLREEIARMDQDTINSAVIEKLIGAKMNEYGLRLTSSVQLDKSIFVKNELVLSDNARTVLQRRYLRKDSDGKVIESPEDMFRRVAHHIARAEENYGDAQEADKMEALFYRMMTEFYFLPNSPTLMNAGRRLGQLAACFVLPVDDSLDGIFSALKNAAMIHKSGGGTGFSFSRLRPKDSRVGSTGGVASGPVSFMKIFNTATEQVKQGGTRRGANMAILRVDHPDILDFITCKKYHHDLNNFNISVGITDAFMESVKMLTAYDLIDPKEKQKVGELNAAEVYRHLVEQAWENGDPGIVFLDRINRDNPTPALGEIESTNPCGEQPLLPFEACNLGSINLAKFVTSADGNPAWSTTRGLRKSSGCRSAFWTTRSTCHATRCRKSAPWWRATAKSDWGSWGLPTCCIRWAYPIIPKKRWSWRRMSWPSSKINHGRPHGDLAEKSAVLQQFRQQRLQEQKGLPLRNATITTIAPTGTLSIIAGCSSGIEPLFALSFVRRSWTTTNLLEVNPYFEAVAKEHGFLAPRTHEPDCR